MNSFLHASIDLCYDLYVFILYYKMFVKLYSSIFYYQLYIILILYLYNHYYTRELIITDNDITCDR